MLQRRQQGPTQRSDYAGSKGIRKGRAPYRVPALDPCRLGDVQGELARRLHRRAESQSAKLDQVSKSRT